MIKKVQELPLDGKKVLVRVDFNVPQDERGKIVDDARLRSVLPTLHYLLEHHATIVLMSHLGRPKGKDPKLSLAPIAEHLSRLLQQTVRLVEDPSKIRPKEVVLLENLRFHPAEEKPELDPAFAKKLASFADFYVDDAFGAAHRAHASITEVPKFFPGKKAAGFLMQKEIAFLSDALLHPKRPFFAIIGGAKIASKLGVLQSLLSKVDALFIGGGMAFTFLKAQGRPIGDSIHEDTLLESARQILASKTKIYLPEDFVLSNQRVSTTIPDGLQGQDIGPKTCQHWQELLKPAQTIFWNGPLGIAEKREFAKGTETIARAIAKSKAISIVGGGDSIAALEKLGLAGKITHVSTGGGACLEYIEGGTLPGIEALK